MSVTTSIYLDTRSPLRKKTQDYPYKLKVYDPTVQDFKRYQTNYGATKEEDTKLSASRLSEKLQALKTTIQDLETQAAEAVKQLDPFSFDDFVRDHLKDNPHYDQSRLKFKSRVTDIKNFDFTEYQTKFPILQQTFEPDTIGAVFQQVIKKKIVWKKVPTAVSYNCSYSSLTAFGGNIRFPVITDTWLKLYTDWFLHNGIGRKKEKSKTTVGIYLRNLRHVFNVAAEELGIIKKDKCYPFGKNKYRIPSSRNIKKAFNTEVIGQLYYYDCNPLQPWVKRAKSFWFFLYFGNGMNPLDVCQLKYKDIQEGFILFERSKTEDTLAEDPPKITVVITEDIQATIDEYGNADNSPDNYIFPFFEPGMTPLQQYKVKQQFVKYINKWMRFILTELGLDIQKAGAYEARHSAATAQIEGGATLLEVQDMLGQIDPKTTRRYVDSLPTTIRKAGAARVAGFKKRIGKKKTPKKNPIRT